MKGELAHRLIKRLYGLTNKRSAEKQIAKRYRRLERARLAKQRRELELRRGDSIPEERKNLDVHHYISQSRSQPINLYTLQRENIDDPAYEVKI